jgi:hypothetical protein
MRAVTAAPTAARRDSTAPPPPPPPRNSGVQGSRGIVLQGLKEFRRVDFIIKFY